MSRWMFGFRVLSLAFAVAALAGPEPAAADYIAPDGPAFDALVAGSAEAPAPPLKMGDLDWFRNAAGSFGHIRGRLELPTKLAAVDGSYINVYLMPLTPYTGWYSVAALNRTVDARRAPAVLDAAVKKCCLIEARTGDAASFAFDNVTEGTYAIFAELTIDHGTIRGAETSDRGWDGNGHGADVRVPTFHYDSSFQNETLVWYVVEHFTDSDVEWNVGVLVPRLHDIGGKPV